MVKGCIFVPARQNQLALERTEAHHFEALISRRLEAREFESSGKTISFNIQTSIWKNKIRYPLPSM